MRTGASLDAVKPWHSIAAAFQLLSRFPVPLRVPFEERVLAQSIIYFPLVGLFIGLALAGAGAGLTAVVPGGVAAALLTVLWVMLTGGLHMDGLMDTADGILSCRSRERMLEIMKDSRVGAMGAIASGLQLLMKYSLLSALLTMDWRESAGLLTAAPIWSRWFMTGAIVFWPSARKEKSMGSMFAGAGLGQFLGGSLIAVLLSIAALAAFGAGGMQAVARSLAGALVAGCCGTLAARRIAGKLGGLTGDTYGAINELLETALLLAAVVYMTH